MKAVYLLLMLTGLLSVNVLANQPKKDDHAHVTIIAHLNGLVHTGEVEFYSQNNMLGSISVYGAWLREVQIDSYGYFKDCEQFEKEKQFITVYNNGSKLKVNEITGSC